MKRYLALLVVLFLVACASSGQKFSIAQANRVKNGMTREEVIKTMGSKFTTVANQGKTFVWSFAKVNGLTGSSESRAVKFSFNDEGVTYGVPEGGAYGNTAAYQ